MTSFVPPCCSFPLYRHRLPKPYSSPFKPSSQFHSAAISVVCLSSHNPSDHKREEVRWLREEQRWLREEQRWLREELRWNRERESLLREISDLRLKIQSLESRNSTQETSVSEMIAPIGSLLQVLKDKSRIAESGSSTLPLVLEERRSYENDGEYKRDIAEEKRVVTEGKQVGALREEGVLNEEEERILREKAKRKTLRKGSEGEEVREMQEALLRLGFYSGEEDMEFSSFSSGTERAVKTWQAAVGVPEDGIMSAGLLERLYMEQLIGGVRSTSHENNDGQTPAEDKEAVNGTAVASVTQISETLQTAVKDEHATEVEYSHHRVFLLGENRWEEPSRLAGSDKEGGQTKSSKTKCLTCRGEGRLMCTECDGTGEPNIEPQFMEWVDEGTKCPYCEGFGYTTCDVCQGKTSV